MSANPASRRPKRRKGPRRPKAAVPSPGGIAAPLKALAETGSTFADKGADDPLSPAEAARMKEHFRFLRAHRKLLKLRLNATEDLLLNGVREPTHRGVCQHLLAKVEKDRVLAQSERLAPAEAAKLLGGVLAFAPEMVYVLRYLECVSGASSKPEARQALVQALRRIPFDDTSNAQMRQILTLIVTVFPRPELPVLMFSWLDNPRFKNALDRSRESLPDELAELVLPLSTLHHALAGHAFGSSSLPSSSEPELRRGLELLFGTPKAHLLELPEATLKRAARFALELKAFGDTARGGLVDVFGSLRFRDSAEASAANLKLAGALLGLGDERRAARVLEQASFEGAELAEARRWQDLLDAPRIGPIALEPPNPRARRRGKPRPELDPSPEPPLGRWLSGFHLPTQTSVRVLLASPDSHEFREQLLVWQRVLVPGVLRPFAYYVGGPQPFVAVRRIGRRLGPTRHDSGRGLSEVHAVLLELLALLHATARSGLVLPDADPGRFSLDSFGRLWLVDVWGSRRAEVAAAVAEHERIARSLVSQVFPSLELPGEARTFFELLEASEPLGAAR